MCVRVCKYVLCVVCVWARAARCAGACVRAFVCACAFVCAYAVFKYVWFACGRVWCAGVWACMCVCARARVCVCVCV